MFGFYGRGPRFNPFWFVFLIIFAPSLFGLAFNLIFSLLPIALIGFVTYSVVKTLAGNSSNKRKTVKSSTVNNKSSLSNADITRIDKKLARYFELNTELPIIDDIALVPTAGNYTNIDSLFLTYKNEKVLKMSEFKNEQPALYAKIVELLKAFSKQPDEVNETKVETKEVKKEVLSDGQKYIEKINQLNAQIPQEEITNGLYQTCELLKDIELSKNSKNDDEKIQKLYDYYLPILTGILENYKKLQDAPIKGDEFKKCEAQLIKTIILINQALKTIYSNIHEDDFVDINADISTLQSLLMKDGYAQDPFAKKD